MSSEVPVPVYFPHPELSHESGVLAIGADLSVDRLLLAYQYGIFPWFNPHEDVLWWYPNPRCVIFPSKIKVAKSMRPYFNQKKYQVSYDTCFDRVIKACRDTYRPGQGGTWLSDDFITSYTILHEMGYVRTVEVWDGEDLVGGLYGVQVANVFCGESMFSLAKNASKFGLISLCRKLVDDGVKVIDCQIETPHLRSLGAEMIPASEFGSILRQNRLDWLRSQAVAT